MHSKRPRRNCGFFYVPAIWKRFNSVEVAISNAQVIIPADLAAQIEFAIDSHLTPYDGEVGAAILLNILTGG